MTIKKKIYNRILAFVLTTAMIFSSSVVASAAELAENHESSKEAIASAEENDISAYASNEFIRTYCANQSKAYTASGKVPCDGKLVVKVDVTGSAKIKVTLKDGIFWSTLYEDSVTNGTSWKISNEAVKQGWTVQVKVTPVSATANFEISAWIQ